MMIALLYDLPVGHHYDIVGVLNRRQTVRNNQHCAYVHHLGETVLNQHFRFRVNISRRLVQYHYFGLVNYRTGKAQ